MRLGTIQIAAWVLVGGLAGSARAQSAGHVVAAPGPCAEPREALGPDPEPTPAVAPEVSGVSAARGVELRGDPSTGVAEPGAPVTNPLAGAAGPGVAVTDPGSDAAPRPFAVAGGPLAHFDPKDVAAREAEAGIDPPVGISLLRSPCDAPDAGCAGALGPRSAPPPPAIIVDEGVSSDPSRPTFP